MLWRNLLGHVFQDEADGAGEGASAGAAVETSSSPAEPVSSETSTETVSDSSGSEPELGQPDHAANSAFVKQWAAGNTDVTTTEPIKETPVVATATDAVSDDDAASPAGDERDELLLNLAEAYDFTREELKGVSNEGLKGILARERRRSGHADAQAPETSAADSSTTTSAAAEAAADAPLAQATFAEYASLISEEMRDEGHGDEAIARRLQQEKLRWDREDVILAHSQKNAERAEYLERHVAEQEQRHTQNLRINEFFSVIDQFAQMGHENLFGRRGQRITPSQQTNIDRWGQVTDIVLKANPGMRVARAAREAFNVAFSDVVQTRNAKAFTRKAQQQANNVLGSAVRAKAPESGEFNGNPWDAPHIVRQFDKMKRNAS